MIICLISAYFYPYSQGGTEKYVLQLAQEYISNKHEVIILTNAIKANENYLYEGVPVYATLESNFSSVDFKNFLITHQIEHVHLHTLTPSFNTIHLKIAKSLGLQTAFTAHVPSITCIHNDLMLYGEKACDGFILKDRCTSCYLHKKIKNITWSKIATQIIQTCNWPTSIAQVTEPKLKEIEEIIQNADKVYIFTKWQEKVFLLNGFPSNLLEITAQTTVVPPFSKEIKKELDSNKEIRIGFVGRICYEKGVHELVNSFLANSNLQLELKIAGIPNQDSINYMDSLKQKTLNYKHIKWSINLNDSEMEEFYSNIDILCIPSIWYETGPYVLYEAFNRGIPVIAKNLGDMQVWKDRGYPIKVYHTTAELERLLDELNKKTTSALNFKSNIRHD